MKRIKLIVFFNSWHHRSLLLYVCILIFIYFIYLHSLFSFPSLLNGIYPNMFNTYLFVCRCPCVMCTILNTFFSLKYMEVHNHLQFWNLPALDTKGLFFLSSLSSKIWLMGCEVICSLHLPNVTIPTFCCRNIVFNHEMLPFHFLKSKFFCIPKQIWLQEV